MQTTNPPTEHPLRNAQSATEAYAKAQIDAANNLASIRALLKRHARIQADEPWNWGFEGDLGAINEKLEEIRRQLR